MSEVTQENQQGYIALLSVIIIGVTLLSIIASESASGSQLQSVTLGTEFQEQARTLAESCANQALAKLLSDQNYRGDTTNATENGVCHIFPIILTTLNSGMTTIKTQGIVRGYYTNLVLTTQVPVICPPTISTTWHEVPTLE